MRRLPAQIALAVGLVTAVVGALFVVAANISPGYPILSALAAGGTVYFVIRRQVSARLEHVDRVLNEMRGRDGDELPNTAGDEIDRLMRRADQARHTVHHRITELSRAEHYRREYVGDVSHEIKTPVFAIQGFAETLLGGALDDRSVNRGFVEKILHHAVRLSVLARDLGEISRLEAGTLQLSRTRIALDGIFADVSESLELAAAKRNVRIHCDVAPDARLVDGDRERIRQVLSNLVDNAIKYNREGGWVRMSSIREHQQVHIAVQDSGIGVDPEDAPRLTERFFRVDKSRAREQGGTGLGLSIVKHILAAHGSTLKIESVLGEGSTFSFRLPAGD